MDEHTRASKPVLQDWVTRLPFMQQTVLLTAIRGPDGLPKYGPTKFLLRWFRRCVLYSAMDGCALTDPRDTNGGSFTGPSLPGGLALPNAIGAGWEEGMNDLVGQYLREVDAIPHHFQLHFIHAAEIIGFKHPDERIRAWWSRGVYVRLVHDMHLHPETEAEMDRRLGDSRSQWLERADPATQE